jgi:hypothetical protein
MTQPILQVLLLCHDVKENLPNFPGTSLFGIFSLLRLSPEELRCELEFWVYARIVDVEGPCEFTITFAKAENESVIGRNSFSIPDVKDPRRPIEISQPVSLLIDALGRYECRVYANGKYLGHTTLYVVEGAASP